MNTLKGIISDIQSHESVSLVKVQTLSNIVFTSIVLDIPDTADYLKIGNQVNIIFKETEVIISKDFNANISIQNKIPCMVQSIKMGVLLCQINLKSGDTEIKSIITSNAGKQLNLKENDKVIALIKTNEVSLSHND